MRSPRSDLLLEGELDVLPVVVLLLVTVVKLAQGVAETSVQGVHLLACRHLHLLHLDGLTD